MTDENRELLEQIQAMIDGLRTDMNDHTRRIEIKIENEVIGRLDALNDGRLLHQDRLHRVETEQHKLREDVDETKTRVTILESKASAGQ